MTSGSQIAWGDSTLPFQLDRSMVRGRTIRLGTVLDNVLSRHQYPSPIETLITEAVLLTGLIGQTIKLRWKLSLQIRGKGAVRLIATDYYGPQSEGETARIRAYANYDSDRLNLSESAFSQLGEGYFALMLDQGKDMLPYQGFTPLVEGSLAACAETYFAQSEQIPTRFVLSHHKAEKTSDASPLWRAGGIMIQHMPPEEGKSIASEAGSGTNGLLMHSDILSGNEGDDWARTSLLLDTVEKEELLSPDLPPTDLLVRLFHEETPRVFDPQPVRFGCSCSEDQVRQTMSIYSQADIAKMTTDDGIVTADCQFCGAHYEMNPETLGFEGSE